MIYILNASPLSIFPPGKRILASWWPMAADEIALELATQALDRQDIISAIGHPDTARVISGLLKRPVEANRTSVRLAPGDKVVVAQYQGPRLAEGATELPEGARMDFYLLQDWKSMDGEEWAELSTEIEEVML